MKYFLKHIIRDVKAFPVQPLLILLTLTLSVAIAVTAFRTEAMFERHANDVAMADAELGDILISQGTSDARIMFESELESIVGDKADVFGEFRLTAITDDSYISVSAADLVAADRYFEFNYKEYGKITTENLKSAAILSSSSANRLGLSLGDSFSVSVLNKEFSYTVCAIAESTGLFANCDMLVSITGVISRLAELSPTIAAMGDHITPCNRLALKAANGEEPAELAELIGTTFSDWRVELTANSTQKDFLMLIQTGSVWLIAAIVIILAAVLTGTCLTLLESKRRLEYASFEAAGASRRTISRLRYTESAIYAIIGAILGIALAHPLTHAAGSLFYWNTEPLTVGLSGVIFGLIFSPALILSCTAIHIKRQKHLPLAEQLFEEESESADDLRSDKKELITTLILIAICFALAILLPGSYRYIPSVIALPLVLRASYIFVPHVIKRISSAVANRQKIKGRSILLMRSFENKFALRHVSRLFVLLLSLLTVISLCRGTLSGALDLMQNAIVGDYAVVGANDSIREELKNDPNIESVSSIGLFMGTELPNGNTLTAISVDPDSYECLNEKILPDKIPKGREAVISSGIADLLKIKKGDAITVTIKGSPQTLTVVSVVDAVIPTLFIDAKSLGLGNDALVLNLTDNARNDESAKSELLSRLEAYGLTVSEPSTLLGTIPATGKGFLGIIGAASIAAAVLTGIGIVNSISAIYRKRTREFKILRLSGMTKAGIAKTVTSELTVIIVFSLLLAIPTSLLLTSSIELTMRSFGMSLI